MAITAGICNSYKKEILSGIHLSSHTYNIVLVTSASTVGPTTASYTGISGEVANGNGYNTGGQALTGFATGASGATVWLTFSNTSWANATITARGALIYNATLSGKNAVIVIDFGSDQISTNGTFAVNMPTANASTALLRLT